MGNWPHVPEERHVHLVQRVQVLPLLQQQCRGLEEQSAVLLQLLHLPGCECQLFFRGLLKSQGSASGRAVTS